MNKARNLVEMGEFYASTVLTEAAKKNNLKGIGKDTFATAGKKTSDVVLPKGYKTKAFDASGPMSNENEKSLVKPLEAKDAKGKSTFTGVEKLSLAPEKIEVEPINNFMTKSTFDKLFEDVMSDNINSPEDADQHDAAALDLPGHDEAGDDEVTITLSKELAGKLHDALMSVLGSDEEQHEDKGELEGEDESEEDAEEHVDGCKCDACLAKKDQHAAMGEGTELEEIKVPGTVHGGGKHPWERGSGSSDHVVKNAYTTHHVDGEEGNALVSNPVDGSGKVLDGQIYGAGKTKADTTPVPKKPVPVDSKVTKGVGDVLFGAAKGAYKGSNTADVKIRDFRKA
jgi:hypothetical protein